MYPDVLFHKRVDADREQQLAAIVWGSVFSHDLILFSAHPVWLTTSIYPDQAAQLTSHPTAPQLRRSPLVRPRHPRCPAHTHREAKAGRHIRARSSQRCCAPHSHRWIGRDRVQQDQPQRHALRVAARHPWPDHVHPYGSAGCGRHNPILCPATVRRRSKCEEAIQVPPRWWICDPACDAGNCCTCDADGLQQERATDPAVGCRGRRCDFAHWRCAAHQAQQVRVSGWTLRSNVFRC